MKLKNVKIGWILTGAFSAFPKTLEKMQEVVLEGGNIIPIMSEYAYSTDTKFGKSSDFIEKIKQITRKRYNNS